ncbi:glycosyltransferase family 2 protein [Methylobacterium sp. HMF5984]|uniref:glycosyltransferase family 2 protein n=1 Tax=Methylobacterium sp. HMF5984 TaxID=3367370 RepID=UPI0038523BF8
MPEIASSNIDLPLTTVIIPTLNEAYYIASTLEQILSSDLPYLIEIIVADGGSTDGTVRIVSDIIRKDSRVRLIHNALRIQSAGINAAALDADPRSSILVRMDAHSKYETTFVKDVVSKIAYIESDSVVVRLKTVGVTCFQRAVASVSNSVSGTGGSRHRMGTSSGYVDHGHHAAIRRTKFLELGGYDESFAANEDAEFDYRLKKSGGKIWLAADIVIQYYPRSTIKSLAFQYFRYGWGRGQNIIKHKQKLRLRQMLPPLLVTYTIAVLLIIYFLPASLINVLLVPFALYLLVIITSAINSVRQTRGACGVAAIYILPAMHFSWGIGFVIKKVLR